MNFCFIVCFAGFHVNRFPTTKNTTLLDCCLRETFHAYHLINISDISYLRWETEMFMIRFCLMFAYSFS